MQLKIEKLTDVKSPYLEKLTDWFYEWWGKRNNSPREGVAVFISNMLCADKVPVTYIATIDGEIVGCFQIVMQDGIWTLPNIYPWLSNVYVDESQRGKGICAAMMKQVKQVCKKLGLAQLYLYTSHVGLYEKYGWEFIQVVNTYGASDAQQKRLYKLTI
jgi:N-acetylglutamate synthase-like GNAT family acetyltransferase